MYLKSTLRLTLMVLAVNAATVSAVDRGVPSQSSSLDELSRKPGHAVRITTNPATGTPSLIRIQPGAVTLAGDGNTAKAFDFLRQFGSSFGVADPTASLELESSHSDRLGMTHLGFIQHHDGIPVFGARLRAHFDGAGQLYAVNGALVPNLDLDTHPIIGEFQASELARQVVAKNFGSRPEELLTTGPALVIYRTGLARGIPGTHHLTWKVEVGNGAGIREFVFVDAHHGHVVDRISGIHEIDRQIHHRSFPRLIWTEGDSLPYSDSIFTSAENEEINDLIAVTSDTYDLYSNITGGEFLSYNGLDRTMNAVYQATFSPPCEDSINASWNGVTTNFCVGLAVDDVVSHEWTHAYTDNTHDLIYAWQPGALNESFSDIFGEIVDLLNGRGLDQPDVPRTDGGCSTFFGNPFPSLTVSSPSSIAGTYDARGAVFNPAAPRTENGFVELVDDGTGTASDGCESIQGFTAGRLALIDRGTCSFIDKATNAAAAGAAGVIIANNDGDSLLNMGGDPPAGYDTPAIFVSQTTGEALKSALAQGVQATIALNVSTDNSVRWLMAEDGAGGAFRDMWNPNCMGNPGRVSDPSYFCSDADGGGVHSNSGIPNHAFALVVDGGTYNGITVGGIGLTRAAHIYWRAMREYQVPTTKFPDHADLLELSCDDLVGATLTDLTTGEPASQVVRTSDCDRIKAAMLATEMRLDPVQCEFEKILDPDAPPLDFENTVYSETFDDTTALDAWTLSNEGVYPEYDTTRNWRISTWLPGDRDGKALFAVNNSFIGNCVPNEDDQSGVLKAESPSITIPETAHSAYVVFDHYIGTEKGWDGGNVKISVNDGDFELVPESAFEFNSFNSSLIVSIVVDGQEETNTNPLAGEFAFTGVDEGEVSGSWGQTQINLDSMAEPGDSIRIRFEFGNDGCTGVEGWYIDTLELVTGGQPVLSVLRPSRRVAP